MKKLAISTLIITLTSCAAFAHGEAIVPAAINSRIFSTQNASPLNSLERTQYTNRSINQLEIKNQTPTQQQIQDTQDTSVSEKKEKEGFFKGFRVIW